MKVIKAVKKPVVVDAIQLTGDSVWEVVTFLEGKPPQSIPTKRWVCGKTMRGLYGHQV